jgi:hypothetical protein
MATEDGAVYDQLVEMLSGEPEQQEEPAAETEEESTDDVIEVEADEAAIEEVSENDAEIDDGEALSLDDIAPYLGMESDRFDVSENGEFMVKVKVDGQESSATLNDIVKSYQLEGHLNKSQMEVAEAKKALTQQQAEFEESSKTKLQQLEDLAGVAQKQLLKDFEAVDWNDLKEYDKAEWSVRREEMKERQEEIQQLMQVVGQERAQQQQQYIAAELQKIPTVIPEWADAGVRDTELKGISTWLTGQGFSQDEQAQIYDSRQFAILRKAWQFDQLQQTKPEVSKKVKKAKKLVKGGTVKSQGEVKKANISKLEQGVKNGTVSVQEYLIKTGKV